MAVAIFSAARQSVFAGKFGIVKRRHIVIERTHCGNVFFQSEFAHKPANSASIKGCGVLINGFAVFNGKFPRIRVGACFAVFRALFKLFSALNRVRGALSARKFH